MPLSEMTVQQFLDALASPSPAPGGGAAAALAGALGAALVSMVCHLTIGKKNYASVSAELEPVVLRAQEKRRELVELMEADAAAYDQVMSSYKLPKDTDEEKATRATAIQHALKEAAEVPFQIAGACADVLDLAQPIAAKGNKSAVSDAGVAALLAEAGLRAAVLNVEINLKLIKEEAFVDEMHVRLKPFVQGRAGQKESIIRVVEARL